MNLKHILEQVPGVNRRFVYYLESQGYIQPKHLPKERIARRDYSEQDLQVIRETWRYYSRGFSLQAAHATATKKQRAITLVTFHVPHSRIPHVMARLKESPDVVEAGVVYAETADFLVKFSTPEDVDVYQALIPLFAEAGVSGIPELVRIVDRFVRDPKEPPTRGQPPMIAYVLIKAPSKTVGQVLTALKQFDEVVEASVLYGESDIIARIVAPSQQELDTLVMERIHAIAPVESTRTYIVVGNLHWSRDGR